MVEKQLKFSFVLDENSFQRVKRALAELTNEAQKFAKALQGTGSGLGLFGGANVGKPPTAAGTVTAGAPKAQTQIGQVVLDNANAFRNMSNLGQQSLRGLTDALKRSVEEQRRQVRGLQESLDALGRTYDRLGGQGKTASAVQAKMISVAGRLTGARESLSGMESMLPKGPELLPEIPWPKGSGGGPPTQVTSSGGGRGGAAPLGMAGALRIAGMVLAGADMAIGEARAGTRSMSTAEATRGDMVNPRIRALRRGDISDMQALRMMDTMSRQDLLKQTGGAGAAFEANWGAIKGVGGNIGRAVPILGKLLGGGGGRSGAILDPLSTDSIEGGKAQNMFDMVDAFKRSTSFLNRQMALESFEGSLGSRINASRILGVGLHTVNGKKVNTYDPLEARLQGQGYSTDLLAGSTQQARLMAGRQFAGQFAGQMMVANAAGYGGYGDVLAAAARSGGLGRADMLARGALGAGIDPAAGIQLGQHLFGFDQRGTTSGAGALMAAQNGFTFGQGPQDFNTVQRIILGMQGGDQLSRGFDSYQQGRNLISAIGINPGGTSYAQDYLGGGMSFKQLLDAAHGEVGVTGRSFGVTSDMARKQLGAMGSSVFDRFVDQGGNDMVSKSIREFRGSGQDLAEFMAGLKGQKGGKAKAEALGAYMGREMGIGEEAGLGLSGLFSGIDMEGIKKGKGPGGGLDEMVGARLKQNAETQLKVGEELLSGFETIIADFKKLPALDELYTNFGRNLNASADNLGGAFARLAEAADIAAYKLSGGAVGKNSSEQIKATPPNKSQATQDARESNSKYMHPGKI